MIHLADALDAQKGAIWAAFHSQHTRQMGSRRILESQEPLKSSAFLATKTSLASLNLQWISWNCLNDKPRYQL